MSDKENVMASMAKGYQENGVVVVRNLFGDWIDGARQAVEQNIANPSWRTRSYGTEECATAFFTDFCVWDHFDGFRNIVTNSPMAELVAALMGSSTATLYHDHVLVKEAGSPMPSPWHQDHPVYFAEGDKTLSLWIPLDPVPEERTIEFVAGSHKWGTYRGKYFDGRDFYDNDPYPKVPDIDARRSDYDIVRWALEPGDAVAFDFKTLHAAPANPSSERRRAISFRWVGDGAVFRDPGGRPSPDFPQFDYIPGRPFGGPMFPVLFGDHKGQTQANSRL